MFAQLCVYSSVLAQCYVTITGATGYPSYRIFYNQQSSSGAARGAAEGDCMCLDYCVSALVLLAVLDVSLDVVHLCTAVSKWILTSVKSTIPSHIATASLPLQVMLMVTLLAVHPVACGVVLALMIVVMKLMRFICITIYKPAVHLPHPSVDRMIQVGG